MLDNNNIMSTEYCNCTNGTTRALCRPICDKDGYKKTKCTNAVLQQGLDPCQEGESELIHLTMYGQVYIYFLSL